MDWPAYYPKYLPFPKGAIRRSRGPVPNQQSVDWPTAQFAPLFLAPGSPSFQPFVFQEGVQRLAKFRPAYRADEIPALTRQGVYPQTTYGPPAEGDIAQTPFGVKQIGDFDYMDSPARNLGDAGSCSSCARANSATGTDWMPWLLGAALFGTVYWYVSGKMD